jgi:LAS superfamily LD-carboxypeptidase LdcB
MSSNSAWSVAQLTGLTESHLTWLHLNEAAVKVHHDVAIELGALFEAASTAGFTLTIASGFRDFHRQKLLWDNKYSGARPIVDSEGNKLNIDTLSPHQLFHAILRWSALPGASRHHWGCDFDLYASNLLPANTQLQLEPWEYFSGHQQPFYHWLLKNAGQFGFFFPYQKDLGGVAIEPWHLSHSKVSSDALEVFSPQVLTQTLRQYPILGQNWVLDHLDSIYTQYVTNICPS